MRIIHCADLHLDSKMTTHLGDALAKERKNELLESFRRMVSYAADNDVEAIIIAGDLFDTKSISATACNVVRDAILNHPEIDFYYLQGNHDANTFLTRLDEIPDNLKLFSDSWTSYSAGGDGKIVISGIELNKGNEPDWYNRLVNDAEKFNIVVLHGQESASRTKNKAEIIPFSELKNKSIDYLALGHIHGYKYEKLDARGMYCYPGCFESRGFDEPGEHGFVVLDISEADKTMKHEFVKFAKRNLYEIRVDVSGCSTTTEISTEVEKQINSENYDSRHMLKIVLCGALDVTAEKDIDLLTKQFADRFYCLKIYDETKLRINPGDYKFDESLKGEFVRSVLAADDLSEEDKMAVISLGIRALSGEMG